MQPLATMILSKATTNRECYIDQTSLAQASHQFTNHCRCSAHILVATRRFAAAPLILHPSSTAYSSTRGRQPYSGVVRERTTSTTQEISRELKPTGLVEHVLYEAPDATEFVE